MGLRQPMKLGGRFKKQLIISLIATNVIAVALGLFFIYSSVKSIVNKQNEEGIETVFSLAENQVSSFIESVDQITKMVAIKNSYHDLLQKDYLINPNKITLVNETLDYFDELTSAFSYIESIYIFSEHGRYIGLSKQARQYKHNYNHYFYSSQLNEKRLSSPEQLVWETGLQVNDFDQLVGNSKYSQTQLISAARQVKLKGSDLDATLIINVNKLDFMKLYTTSGATKKDSFYIIDNEGTIISHKDRNLVGKKIVYFDESILLSHGETTSHNIRDGRINKKRLLYKIRDTHWWFVYELPLKVLYKDVDYLKTLFIIILIIVISVEILLSIYWVYRITRPLTDVMFKMRQLESGQLGIKLEALPHNELGDLGNSFNRMSNKIKILMEENIRVEEERSRLEIETLQLQLNPHFMYNTLNTIKWMALMMNAPNIANSLTILGNLLKPVFQVKDSSWSIPNEIMYIKNYTEMMNLRYGDKVSVIIEELEQQLEFTLIPKFIIQPLVENAFIHGLTEDIHKMTINISISISHIDDEITIIIKDTGCGMTSERLEEVKKMIDSNDMKSIGLINVYKRLNLCYGDKFCFEINSTLYKGSSISMRIPVVPKQ